MDVQFLVEALVGGLLAGVMYSLVAIGFVLVYKASGVFNFAQGSMVLCAALTFVTLCQKANFEFWPAVGLALIMMVTLGIVVERVVLRPLVNKPQITLFMATLGLSFVIEGLSQLFMGAAVYELDLGIIDIPKQIGPIAVSQFDLVAAGVSGVLVVALSLFFTATRTGISLRAVAEDPQAALSIGIRLQVLWRIAWGVAGVVSLVAGLLWGSRQGVQFSLTFVVMKALPVLIIGGFTSIEGAIVGGLIVGASDAVAEIYLAPLLGGSVSTWFVYVLAVGFLMVRPAGLFGERAIDRV